MAAPVVRSVLFRMLRCEVCRGDSVERLLAIVLPGLSGLPGELSAFAYGYIFMLPGELSAFVCGFILLSSPGKAVMGAFSL